MGDLLIKGTLILAPASRSLLADALLHAPRQHCELKHLLTFVSRSMTPMRWCQRAENYKLLLMSSLDQQPTNAQQPTELFSTSNFE